MRSTLRLKLVGLALALAASASLVAVASRDSGAYFSDVHMGAMTGTLASAPGACPYRLGPGCSKAERWEDKGCRQTQWSPIATAQPGGGLRLDFGDAIRCQRTTWPDVFRLVSLVSAPHAVSFSVSGPIAAFVTEAHLQNGAAILPAGATASVLITVSVPPRARIGTYAGTLTVHVAGWSHDAELPLTITVCVAGPHAKPTPMPTPTPSCTLSTVPKPSPSCTTTPSPTPSGTPSTSPSASCKPSTSPTPVKSPTPSASAEPANSGAPVPLATPTGSPGAGGA
jgi:hypothetical protein